MYKHIPEFGDEEGHSFWKSGIAGVASEARKFCQPQWHGFDVWAETADMFRLSLTAQAIEDRFNLKLEQEARELGDEFTATHGNATRLMAGLREAVVSDLPGPYRDCVSLVQGAERNPFAGFADNPLVVMVLAAQSLGSADESAEYLSTGDGLNAMKRLDRAALSLAHAAEFSGFQEAARGERKAQAELHARRSAQGGRARADRYASTKKWVLDRYLERTWPSERQAALSLFQGALELSREVGAPLSEDRAFMTVYGWLLAARGPA